MRIKQKCASLFWLLVMLVRYSDCARGGRRKASKGKNLLPFEFIKEFSMLDEGKHHPLGAKIVRSSHFSQSFRLGYKILLVCEAEGDPVPQIKWFKDGFEIPIKRATHIYMSRISEKRLRSKLEIDPATVGDQGTFTCMADNRHSVMFKNFKTEYEM